jgi:hypothetical protein
MAFAFYEFHFFNSPIKFAHATENVVQAKNIRAK